MATQKNRVEWEFLLNQRELDRGLKRSKRGFEDTDRASSTLKTTMGGLTRAAGALGLALGAREVVQFGLDAIDAASDYEEAVNAIEVATGTASEDIIEFGSTAAEAIGLSETAVIEAGVAFSGFAEKIESDQSVADTFEDYITRVTDFGSVMNLTTDEALAKFQSALAGESEPLRRFGLDVSAAAVATYALEAGITEVGEQMSEDDKVTARYGLLMQETAKFAGDFAETAESAANKQKILTARFEDAQVELGKKLLPAYTELLEISVDLVPVLGAVAGKVADLAADVGTVITPVADLTSELSDASEKSGLLDRAFGFLGEAGSQLGKNIISGPRDATLNFRDSIIELNEWLSAADETQERFNEEIVTATNEMGDYVDELDLVPGELAAIETATDDVTTATDLMTEAEKQSLGVYDLIRQQAFETLQKLRDKWGSAEGRVRAYEQAVKDANAQLDLMAGKVPSGGFVTPGGQVGLAGGGTLSQGETAMVGERGPEIITAGSSMRVHPNGTNPYSGGGGGNSYTINVTAIDPASAAEAVADAIRTYESTNGPI